MARIPAFQQWTQGVSSFPKREIIPKPAYSANGDQALSSYPLLPGDIKLKRITDREYFEANVPLFDSRYDFGLRHAYSRKQVFNSDNSKILLNCATKNHAILKSDGSLYTVTTQGQKYPLWANTSPWHLFATTEGDTTELIRTDIRDDSTVDIISVNYAATIGESEGDISNDDTKIVLTSENNGNIRLTLVDIPNGTSTEINIGRDFGDLDWASVSPLGNYVVVAYDKEDHGARDVDVYDWNTRAKLRRLCYQQHGDLGIDNDGDEAWITIGHGQSNDSPGTTSLASYKLSTGEKTIIFGGNNEFPNSSTTPTLDGHVSASCTRFGVPIVIVSCYSSSGGPHVVFGVKTDGSRDVCYYGYHHSLGYSYVDEPQANVSRDGIYCAFASDWWGSGHTELYLAWDNQPENFAGTESNPHKVYIGGGRQQFEALSDLPGSTLIAVEDLPAEVPSNLELGHYMEISASYGLGFGGRKSRTMANLVKYLQDDNFKGGLFHLYWKDQSKYESFIQSLFDTARPYGKSIIIDYSDIRFNATGIALSSTPVPQYVKDEGRVTYSGNPNNQSICSSMATDPVCKQYFISSLDYFEQWDDDPSFAGLMLPETTRSQATSAGGPYSGINDGMVDLYLDLIDEVKPKLQKSTIGISVNFTDSGVEGLRPLFVKASVVGGIVIYHPDTIEGRDPDRPGGVTDYAYLHYGLDREFADDIVVGCCMQTRDIGPNIDQCYELAVAPISTFPRSLQANVILSYGWHPDYGSSWEQMAVDKIAEWDGAYHTNASSLNYKTGTSQAGSDHMSHAQPFKNGQKVDLVPDPNVAIGTVDTLSIFTSLNGAITESIEYFEYVDGGGDTVVESDGVVTDKEFHSYEMGGGQFTVTGANSSRLWTANNTETDGYSGDGYLESVGHNTQADSDLGTVQRIPLSDLSDGKTFKQYMLMFASDAGSDSCWALKEGVSPVLGTDTFITAELHGAWNWILALDGVNHDPLLLTSDDVASIGGVRENNVKWSKTVFIDASETRVPTGLDGFAAQEDKATNDSFIVASNISSELDVLANDDTGLTLIDVSVGAAHGVATVSAGKVSYTPSLDYTGNDSFSYRASDSSGAVHTATADVVVDDFPPPVAEDFVVEDIGIGDLVIDFGAHVSSPTGLDLTMSHWPEFLGYYNTSVVGMVVTYTALTTPPVSFGGNYSVRDELGNYGVGTLNVQRIIPDNDPPSPVYDSVIARSGVPIDIHPLSNDIDPDGHELTLLGLEGEPRNGTAVISGNTITYTSFDGFIGGETINYRVRDLYGASTVGVIRIAVAGPDGVGIYTGGVTTAKVRVNDRSNN